MLPPPEGEQILAGLLPKARSWLPFTSSEIFDLGTDTASLGKDLPQCG